jgi:hypothetical protein
VRFQSVPLSTFQSDGMVSICFFKAFPTTVACVGFIGMYMFRSRNAVPYKVMWHVWRQEALTCLEGSFLVMGGYLLSVAWHTGLG